MAASFNFMPKSSRKNVPDAGTDLGNACITIDITTDPTTAPDSKGCVEAQFVLRSNCV